MEKDTVIRDFRKQIFDKNNEPPGYYEKEEQLDQQQRHLNQLLNKGSREEVAQYSRKIMQHFVNEKNMYFLIYKGLKEDQIKPFSKIMQTIQHTKQTL